ncbi:2049_t:CDS:2 [Gigaspora margarita]|uniref:2049_t:CDS:1 n=1 Tax=Gigaspora margarita TaxID=4874 RepID=A0ABN7UQT9_GIGMA|nr:2049_t:CDS:2 [Gigaspora margarita]
MANSILYTPISATSKISQDPKFNKCLQGLWKHNLICQTIDEASKHQISFKPKSIEWRIKGEGPTILELLSPKLNFKIAKALEKLNIFYINQLIFQNSMMLATWGQFKLIKNITRKERKPIWFRHLKSITLQDVVTKKIKNSLSMSADLKGLAIPNLQRLSSNNRVKDWIIAKEIDNEPTLGHIIKKNSNSVLIEHWKEFDYAILSQSKLEKYKKCSLTIDLLQESCTLRLSKKRILDALPKGALESPTKITKIKSNLWQRAQDKQQSNPESAFLSLKDIECLKIELIQKQYFDNKLSLQLIEELRYPESQNIAPVEGIPNRQPYKKNASNYRKFYNRNRMALF